MFCPAGITTVPLEISFSVTIVRSGASPWAMNIVHDAAVLHEVVVASLLAHHLAAGDVNPGKPDDVPHGHVPRVFQGFEWTLIPASFPQYTPIAPRSSTFPKEALSHMH
jgi:hypothetical protein